MMFLADVTRWDLVSAVDTSPLMNGPPAASSKASPCNTSPFFGSFCGTSASKLFDQASIYQHKFAPLFAGNSYAWLNLGSLRQTVMPYALLTGWHVIDKFTWSQAQITMFALIRYL
jgi:hypothetical protein